MPDFVLQTRKYLESAEAAWGGSLRTYAALLERYVEDVHALMGSDEKTCHVCGRANFSEDGLTHNGCWLSWNGASFCEDHKDHFNAYIESTHRYKEIVQELRVEKGENA